MRSLASASDAPIPAAGPFTAASTGLGISRTSSMIGGERSRRSPPTSGWPPAVCSWSALETSRRSAPAEKARPAPVRRTARTASSAAASRRAARSSSPRRRFHALRASGRSRTIVVAAPSRRTVMVAASVMTRRYPSTRVDSATSSTYVDGHERTGRHEAGGVGRHHRPGPGAAGGRLAADARRAPRGPPRRPGPRPGLVVAGHRRGPGGLQAGGPPQARRRAAAAEGRLMFERFTEEARAVTVAADRHAAALRHGWIGTEHLLLGLLDDPDRRAARILAGHGVTGPGVRAEVERIVGVGEPDLDADALAALGIDLDAVRERVERTFGPGALARRAGRRRPAAGGGARPFTPRAKKALELSLREAVARGDSFIGAEHLLLGLLREGDGVAARILRSAGVTRDGVLAALARDAAA